MDVVRKLSVGIVAFAGAVAPAWSQQCFGTVWDAPVGGELTAVAGDALYSVGGLAGTPSQRRVARYDGASWTLLPGDFDGRVHAVTELAGELVVGGEFTAIDGAPRAGVARFDGSGWTPLGQGLSGAGASVQSLAVFQGELIAGGDFAFSGAAAASNLARFDGQAWSALGGGLDGPVADLELFGDRLAIGGSFVDAGGAGWASVAAWDGAVFAPLGSVTLPPVHDLVARGASLAAMAGSVHAFDGSDWSLLDAPPFELNALGGTLDADGDLFVHGQWDSFCKSWSGDPCMLRARYDDDGWSLFGFDDQLPYLTFLSLATFDGAVWETGGTERFVRHSDDPALLWWTPDEASWYAPPVLSLRMACDDPALPLTVEVDGGPPLAASYVDPDWQVALPTDWTATTGRVGLRVDHAGATIHVPEAIEVLPKLTVNVVTLFAQEIVFRVETETGIGDAWIVAAAATSSVPLNAPPLFSTFDLDLGTSVLLGAAPLSEQTTLFPTLEIPIPQGVPPGTVIPVQALALELFEDGPLSAFTPVVDVVLP